MQDPLYFTFKAMRAMMLLLYIVAKNLNHYTKTHRSTGPTREPPLFLSCTAQDFGSSCFVLKVFDTYKPIYGA